MRQGVFQAYGELSGSEQSSWPCPIAMKDLRTLGPLARFRSVRRRHCSGCWNESAYGAEGRHHRRPCGARGILGTLVDLTIPKGEIDSHCLDAIPVEGSAAFRGIKPNAAGPIQTVRSAPACEAGRPRGRRRLFDRRCLGQERIGAPSNRRNYR